MTNQLSEVEFKKTFSDPMRRVSEHEPAPFEFWEYFDAIPTQEFEGHDCSDGQVTYVWEDGGKRFLHVLVSSKTKNVFMVLVLNLRTKSVEGHRLLDLNKEYGLEK